MNTNKMNSREMNTGRLSGTARKKVCREVDNWLIGLVTSQVWRMPTLRSRNPILLWLLAACAIATLVRPAPILAQTPAPSQRDSTAQPNIVFILADDLGYGDLSSYGSQVIKTPHIDQLAASGVRFTQGYVSHPVCSPSRAGLMTGRYQQRHGWMYNPASRDRSTGMSTKERTLGNMMQAHGYRTGLIGKWHLGQQPEHRPTSRGFHEYFGILEGGSIFIDSRKPGVEVSSLGGGRGPTERHNSVWRVRRNSAGEYEVNETVEVSDYLTDTFTEEAVDFIERNAKEPFFLFLSHTTPHTPLQATAKYLELYRSVESQPQRVYAAMVGSLDESVRRVVQELKDQGVYENTLLVFASDNGCAGYVHGACSNAPLRGFKRYHHEGGVRVPFIMSWPSRLAGGEIYEKPVISLDLFSTFSAAAGGQETTEDSVNLLPYLASQNSAATESGSPHETLFWRAGENVAARDDRWKLIRLNRTDLRPVNLDGGGRVRPPEGGWPEGSPHGRLTLLYDLEADPGETTNVAASHPEIVGRLGQAIEVWRKDHVDPIQPAIRSTLVEFDGEWVQLVF